MHAEDEMHDEILPLLPDPDDGAPWQAPALREQRLYELCRRDEAGEERAHYEYLRAVAVEGLYRPVTLPAAEGSEGAAPLTIMTLEDGRRVVPAYTVGVLPRPHPEVVYEFTTLGGLDALWPDDVDILLVNGGTPCARWFLADGDEREVWRDLHAELYEPDGTCDRVETRWTGAPEDEAVLRGLACGAHLCYANGDAWNTLNWHGAGYANEAEGLSDDWGVEDRDDWLRTQERLLRCEVSAWQWHFVLDVRNLLARETRNARIDPVAWRDHVETAFRAQAGEAEAADLDAHVSVLRELVGEVMRYEARFRADALLPPDGYVRSVAAWDLGRASMVARRGRGARYATQAELRDAVERAGHGARAAYGSWAEFSAGYVLGRCLHFDEETFGDWYTTVLEAHRVLMTHPESPWATIPLH
ncbi:DUF1266 domain-containing protein [Nonomuraea indica]|uniref:DUF1266 domain-containing protein n=1 Tax=Nonomuraea indica TaxID=1581193 RepID=UPI000C7E4843|nr:DUF1266 domain-containing protein [Nonomuraea indica]